MEKGFLTGEAGGKDPENELDREWDIDCGYWCAWGGNVKPANAEEDEYEDEEWVRVGMGGYLNSPSILISDPEGVRPCRPA